MIHCRGKTCYSTEETNNFSKNVPDFSCIKVNHKFDDSVQALNVFIVLFMNSTKLNEKMVRKPFGENSKMIEVLSR